MRVVLSVVRSRVGEAEGGGRVGCDGTILTADGMAGYGLQYGSTQSGRRRSLNKPTCLCWKDAEWHE